MRIRRYEVLAVVLAGALVVCSAGGAAGVRGRSAAVGNIVFSRAGGSFGDETVFVAHADGTRQRRISKVGMSCCPFAARPGSRVDIGGSVPDGRVTSIVMALDGTHRRILPLPKGTLNLGGGPFSPDGKTIAREGFDESHPSSA